MNTNMELMKKPQNIQHDDDNDASSSNNYILCMSKCPWWYFVKRNTENSTTDSIAVIGHKIRHWIGINEWSRVCKKERIAFELGYSRRLPIKTSSGHDIERTQAKKM
uniref:uncharacterized protein LOC120329839 n=1 Tax=Styela clava TaxID=7725 RepID=UPI001939A374|nr:uncharacterized protein LOC120329839 [Styela clava]